MTKFHRMIVFLILITLIAACGPATIQPAPQLVSSATDEPVTYNLPAVQIVRHPEPADFSIYCRFRSAPVYDPNSTELWQVDLRSCDMSDVDLSKSGSDLLHASFDDKTIWPPQEKMAADFDRQKITELNKDPGLGVRLLHEQGITGKGIGIAIIDQILLVDHIEYKERVRVYEEADDVANQGQPASMHGAAVASIAVGKSVGVAPEADLYFIATYMCSQGTYETNDFACLAKSIQRIIEINANLPVEHKIRVLSISVGWGPQSKGYTEVMSALKEAEAAGIFVLNTSIARTHNLKFHGLGRSPLSDPNDFRSYGPGTWWQKDFYQQGPLSDTLLVPMDSRTAASPTGIEDYVFYSEGGWSWSVPYLAGMYALTVQVKPDITPQEFWATALKTGRTIEIGHDGKDYQFGVILDPQALIEALQAN